MDKKQLTITVGMTIGTILVALNVFTPDVHAAFETLWPSVVGVAFEVVSFVALFAAKKKDEGEILELKATLQGKAELLAALRAPSEVKPRRRS